MSFYDVLKQLVQSNVLELIKTQYYTFNKFSLAKPEIVLGDNKLVIENSIITISTPTFSIELNSTGFLYNSTFISYEINKDDFEKLTVDVEYAHIKLIRNVFNKIDSLIKTIKIYSYEPVPTGYVLTLNDSKVFKHNRFGIVSDEQYIKLIASEMNIEVKNPTPDISTGTVVKDFFGAEGVIVHVVKGTDFEHHGMIEVYLTDKKYFEHYPWVQWHSILTVIEPYD